VGEKIPDGDTNAMEGVILEGCPSTDVKNLHGKIQNMKKVEADKRTKEANTIERYAQLRKKGYLGSGQAGKQNREWANTEAPKITADPCTQRSSSSELPLGDGCATTTNAYEDVVATLESPKKASYTKETHEVDESMECMDAWVQCATCMKWRLLPHDIDVETLPEAWIFSNCAKWRFGLNCDVEEDSSDANEVEPDVTDCHQSRNTPFRVKLVSVTMQQEEETWIRNEWGLRQCNTWGDGYCGYRSAAALRGTTMMKLLDDLLYFWGWKWAKKRSEPQATYKTCKQYEHWYYNAEEENYIEDFTLIIAQTKIEALKKVQTALAQSMDILKSKYWCPDDLFESLAVMDNMDVMFIDTSAQPGIHRYRMYGRNGCQHFFTMDQVSAVMSAKIKYGSLRGVAFGHGHFCPLYPRNMQPNFAGKHAIGPHE
jgi:hypothetical protein